MSVDAKVALVIGASRGIGAQAARALAAEGAAVVLGARTVPLLEQVANEISEAGGEALPVETDAADPASIGRLVERTLSAYGRLDIAVNNAAANHRQKPLADVTLEEFDEVVALNLRGLFVAVRAEVGAMLRSGGGAIVNVASTAGLRGVPGVVGYASTKHAAIGLTEVAALDYASAGIRVNAVAPGPIATDRLAGLPEAVRAQIADTVPMGRLGTVEDVANLITWLASDRASFVNGAVFVADGGRLAGGA
jgi:NAD(P)-dependent dehydrogenase (short-subunit alcohol dehydrogenase family)